MFPAGAGNSVATLVWVNDVAATVATPTQMPANAPSLVTGLRGSRLAIRVGKSWVTKL